MKKDRTKRMFAEELQKMLEQMPLQNVRVSELCRRCEVTTPTFYYYFHDKYELAAWIFVQDYSIQLSKVQAGYSPQILEAMNRRFEEKKNFYRKAYDDRSQNSISEYILAFDLKYAEDAFAYAGHGEKMSEEQLLQLRYHNYGVQGLFREWLSGKGQMTTKKMSEFLFEKTPDFLKKAYAAYAKKE